MSLTVIGFTLLGLSSLSSPLPSPVASPAVFPSSSAGFAGRIPALSPCPSSGGLSKSHIPASILRHSSSCSGSVSLAIATAAAMPSLPIWSNSFPDSQRLRTPFSIETYGCVQLRRSAIFAWVHLRSVQYCTRLGQLSASLRALLPDRNFRRNCGP